MATKKISQLIETTTAADNDYVAILQTSTTSTKKIQRQNLLAGVSPAGMVAAFAAAVAPTGWLLCNGQAVSRTTYSALFSAIGVTYGTGDGSTTFNVPNLAGRVPVGVSGTDSDISSVGKIGGEKNHTLTPSELAAHSHGLNDPGHAHGVYDPGHNHQSIVDGQAVFTAGSNNHTSGDGAYQQITWGNAHTSTSGSNIGIYGAGTGISVQNSGSNVAHNNMQPYMALSYIIKT